MTITVSRNVLTGVAVVVAAGLLAACSNDKPGKVVTVTVPPTGAPSASATGSTTGSAAPTGSATPTTTTQTTLPGTCDSLLPTYAVAQAIGTTFISGTTAFVVGVPDAAISRLANINCRYGVSGTGDAAKTRIEIGVSLYSTATAAAARITATTEDYTAHGASAADVTVAGAPAQVLTGGVGTGYAEPVLVTTSGQRTVAVTLDPSVATGAKATTDLTKIAELAAQKTAG